LSPDSAEKRILIADELDPAAMEILSEHGFTPTVATGLGENELCKAIAGVHALIVRSATKVTRRVLEAADVLEVVGRAGVGVDNVDTAAATERGVIVMNTPEGNTVTTAELAVALLVSLARHVPLADRRAHSGSWSKKGLMGTELAGKTLGVVGLGRIGRVVAERAMGLAMNVIATDPYLSQTGASSPLAGVELVELDELLGRADFVSLHVPLSDSTRNLLSRERLARMKQGARLINAARGGLVDEQALAEELSSGHLAGAALDVLAEEPPPPDHPLLAREDVILTPHLGASSHEAQFKVAVAVAEQIVLYFEEGVARNAVNAPVLSAQALRAIRHYLIVAERMGSFVAQRARAPIGRIEFTVSGEISRKDRGTLALAFLVAVLRQSMDEGVNMVNAPHLAAERGIRLLESHEEGAQGFTSLLEARTTSKDGKETHTVAGTVFGVEPRLVRVDDMHVDLDPSGYLLITRHHDRPGVLGQIGTLLGAAGVNIRRVELGPPTEGSGGLAMAFLTLYDVPPASAVEKIRALEPIRSAELVRL
jgi:D-3-phosphoglycerate dehydrogenase